jgi:hypothetical protein
MKSKKNISAHLDEMMNEASNPQKVHVSDQFLDHLNTRLDAIDSQSAPSTARIFTLTEFKKYAAVFIILMLNVAVLWFVNSQSSVDTSDEIVEFADEYFPDYSITLTSLE